MPAYNGHRSWNAWNVSLWINNSEDGLYFYARDLAKQHGVGRAATILARDLEGQRTPDGAKYNRTCIYEAIRDILT